MHEREPAGFCWPEEVFNDNLHQLFHQVRIRSQAHEIPHHCAVVNDLAVRA